MGPTARSGGAGIAVLLGVVAPILGRCWGPGQPDRVDMDGIDCCGIPLLKKRAKRLKPFLQLSLIRILDLRVGIHVGLVGIGRHRCPLLSLQLRGLFQLLLQQCLWQLTLLWLQRLYLFLLLLRLAQSILRPL